MAGYTISDLDEQDLDAYVDCEFEAFKGYALHDVVFPTPQTSRDIHREQLAKAKSQPAGNTTILLKATDNASGRIIGGINMTIHGSEEAKTTSPYLAWIKEANPEADEDARYQADVTRITSTNRVTLIDGQHAMIDLLFVHPDFGRRGIGAELVAKGCKLADESGLTSYVEASTNGKRTYEVNGFETTEVVDIALEQWPGRPSHKYFWMSRRALSKKASEIA